MDCRARLSTLAEGEARALPPRGTERIRAAELLSGMGPAAAHGSPGALAHLRAPVIRRRFDTLWEARLPADADPARLRVRIAPSAGPGPEARAWARAVRVTPSTPRRVCRRDGWQLVTGGGEIAIDMGAVDAAGPRRIALEVRIDGF